MVSYAIAFLLGNNCLNLLIEINSSKKKEFDLNQKKVKAQNSFFLLKIEIKNYQKSTNL